MLILFNPSKRGISIGVFITPQFLHSQKLYTCLGQKYHLEWYFLMRPAQTMPGVKNRLMFQDVTG